MSLHIVAELMAISARTAPKAVGQDFLAIKIVEGEELRRLGEEMIAYGERVGKKNFDRDGKNVLNSEAVLLIGLKDARTVGLNCAACGSPTCIQPNTVEGEFRGPQCAMRLLDMGIAIDRQPAQRGQPGDVPGRRCGPPDGPDRRRCGDGHPPLRHRQVHLL